MDVGRDSLRGPALAALVLVAAPSLGLAQTAPGAPPSAASQTVQSPDQAEGGTAVGEILVTAQKRTEDIKDVPISMTAASGATLKAAGITDINDIALIAPSFTSREWGDSRTSIITMRGVASQEANPGEQSSIGVFLDGVFMSRTGMGSSQDLLDVERVEVLRGPQGTLFGMNTAAGLVNVITRNPDMTDMRGEAELVYGSYNDVEARGVVSGPLVADTLGFSVAGYIVSHDGYTFDPVIDRHVDDAHKAGVRGKLRYDAGNFDATLSLDYHRETSDCCAAVITTLLPGANLLGVPVAPLALAGYPYSRETIQGEANQNPNDGGGATLEMNWRLPSVTLTSLSAYRFWNASPVSDIDSLPPRVLDNFVIQQRHEQVSEELRAASPSGERLEWVAGVFVFDHRSTDYENLALGPDPPSFFILPGTNGATVIRSKVDDTSYAAFGHVDYHLTDRLTASAGARYTQEPQDADFTQTSNNLAYPTLGSTHQTRDDGAFTWTADLSYKWT